MEFKGFIDALTSNLIVTSACPKGTMMMIQPGEYVDVQAPDGSVERVCYKPRKIHTITGFGSD